MKKYFILILCIAAALFFVSVEIPVFRETVPDLVHILQNYGWEVEKTPIEIVDLTIPNSFDMVYNNYNELQKKSGFDLEPYKGKRVKRYTYRVLNYPDPSEKDVMANILVCENTIIGGDIMTPRLDGFMLPLKRQ